MITINDIIEQYVKERIAEEVNDYKVVVDFKGRRIESLTVELEQAVSNNRTMAEAIKVMDERMDALFEQTKLDKDCIDQLTKRVQALTEDVHKAEAKYADIKSVNEELMKNKEKTVKVNGFQYTIEELYETYKTVLEDRDRYYDIISEAFDKLRVVM